MNSPFSRERLFAHQLAQMVIRPTLARLGLGGPVPMALLLGTAAHESDGFDAICQLGTGPARGFWQVEPATDSDVWTNFLSFHPVLMKAMQAELVPSRSRADQLADNLSYGCAMARLIYYRVSEPLPATPDPALLAGYWKRHFNTPLGAGTEAEFITHFNNYVGDINDV
jgi:hypothetical protein